MKLNENEILSPGLISGPGLGPGPAGLGPGLDETPGIGIGICQEPVPIPEPILNAYYLGGDASKGYCDFIILDQFKQVVEDNFQLDDTFEGHQALFKVLEEFFRKHPAAVLYAGFESTGGYENNWYNFLWQLHGKGRFNIGVTRLNPYGVRHHKEASLERIDTDKISARKIASYLISYPEKVEYNKEDNLSFLRMHWKTIRLMKKQYIQWVTQLKSQLYVLHPQLLTYCVEGMPAWVLQVVTKYPTAFRLARANAKTLAKVPYVTEERAEELIDDAKKSVASISTAHPNVEHFIRTSAYQVLNLGRTTAEQEVKMMEGYQSHFPNSEMEILVSFPGIAQYSAFGLLIEIGSIHRFSSVKHLVSFFGIHPVYRKSGDGTWGMHMSKKGRKEPRWILFNVARSAIGCNEMIRELYNGYVAKGKSKMAALGMIMHKILRIIYGMLKNNKKYDPQIDIANRKKKNSQQKNQDNKTDKNRRYQENDPNAPISGRQTKKRKKEKEEVSQSGETQD